MPLILVLAVGVLPGRICFSDFLGLFVIAFGLWFVWGIGLGFLMILIKVLKINT